MDGQPIQLARGEAWCAPLRIGLVWLALLASASLPGGRAGVAQEQETLPPGQREQSLELVEYRDLPLGEAVRLFAEETGLNIVPSAEAFKTKISLSLRNVTPAAALDALTKQANLWSRRDAQTGIIHIYTVEEYRRDLTSFREEKTEVFTMLYPNPVEIASAIRDLFGDRVQLSFGNDDGVEFKDLSERFDRFDLVDGRSQGLGFFQGGNGGGSRGGAGGGGGFNSGNGFGGFGRGGPGGRRSDFLRQSRTGALVEQRPQIQAQELERLGWTPDKIEKFEQFLAEGKTTDQALLDELFHARQATIYVTVVRRHNQVIVRTSDDRTMVQIRDLVAQLDVPTPLVLLEVKVMQVTLGDGFNSAFDLQFSDGQSVAGGFTGGNILPPASDADNNPATRIFSNVAPGGTGLQAGALTFQYVNASFRSRMQLLENRNRITILATPLLLTANNEVSRLFVGQEVPLNRSFSGPQPLNTTIVNNANVAPTAAFGAGSTDIEFRPVGTTLLITPNINADRTVTLRILQEVSSVVPDGTTVLVPNSTGFSNMTINTVRSQNVSGTVVAKDGMSVAIGGLIDERATDTRDQVPVIGRIPVLGFFFRRQQTGRSKSELIIMIRPYVFNTPAESAALSQELLHELSVHPTTVTGRGSLDSFSPNEVVRPVPSTNHLENIFRFHNVEPKTY